MSREDRDRIDDFLVQIQALIGALQPQVHDVDWADRKIDSKLLSDLSHYKENLDRFFRGNKQAVVSVNALFGVGEDQHLASFTLSEAHQRLVMLSALITRVRKRLEEEETPPGSGGTAASPVHDPPRPKLRQRRLAPRERARW